MHRRIIHIIISVLIMVVSAVAENQWFDLPKLPHPSEYGNILIARTSEKHDMKPVVFSHWRHRLQYTCRVCHFELDFGMKVNMTEITEEKNRQGEFCGACHNGDIAFGHTEENCTKCHNGDISYGKEKFEALKVLPQDNYGNKIDWSLAISMRRIKPRQSILEDNYNPIPFRKFLELKAEWPFVPPAVFPHRAHVRWLDCANCHPDIFNIKKKTTKHFTMLNMLDGKFCGVCHLKIAFPLDDCKRCHPGIKTGS